MISDREMALLRGLPDSKLRHVLERLDPQALAELRRAGLDHASQEEKAQSKPVEASKAARAYA